MPLVNACKSVILSAFALLLLNIYSLQRTVMHRPRSIPMPRLVSSVLSFTVVYRKSFKNGIINSYSPF